VTRRDRRGVGPVRALALASAFLALAVGPAGAHPHVFIDYAVTLVVAGDRLSGVRLAWTFDDLFSGFILQEFDKDRNGTLSAPEVQDIEATHLAEFHKVGYYTTVNVNGKPVTSSGAREFRATAAKGIVTYEFILPLGVPLSSATTMEVVVDPRRPEADRPACRPRPGTRRGRARRSAGRGAARLGR
jgi:ABC-type uncharacterized transport system substrate-binding protein